MEAECGDIPKKLQQQHQEEHNEEAEWHVKDASGNASWSKVMKVTKKIEKTSKTEEHTRTYKVIGTGESRKIIELDATTKLPKEATASVEKKEQREQEETNETDKEKPNQQDDQGTTDGGAEKSNQEKMHIQCCPCCKKCTIS